MKRVRKRLAAFVRRIVIPLERATYWIIRRLKRVSRRTWGVFLICVIFYTGHFQINEMMMVIAGYEKLKEWIWVPELGLSALHAFMIFWNMVYFSVPAILLLWHLTENRRSGK